MQSRLGSTGLTWQDKAICAAMAYELAHKCVILPRVRVRQLKLRDHHDEKEKIPRPLMISEIILPTAFATMGSPLLAPFQIMGDLQRMEAAARGLDKELYGIEDIELKQFGNSWGQGYLNFWELASI